MLIQGLLSYKVVLLTLLGLLAAGVAGRFGGPLALDGRGWRNKFGGWLIVGLGCLGSIILWSWGILGYPSAFLDLGASFGRTVWRLLLST